jgi:hypothetical protein
MKVQSNRFWASGSGDVRVELIFRAFFQEEGRVKAKVESGPHFDFFDFSTVDGRLVRRLAKGNYQDVYSGKVFKSNDPDAP